MARKGKGVKEFIEESLDSKLKEFSEVTSKSLSYLEAEVAYISDRLNSVPEDVKKDLGSLSFEGTYEGEPRKGTVTMTSKTLKSAVPPPEPPEPPEEEDVSRAQEDSGVAKLTKNMSKISSSVDENSRFMAKQRKKLHESFEGYRRDFLKALKDDEPMNLKNAVILSSLLGAVKKIASLIGSKQEDIQAIIDQLTPMKNYLQDVFGRISDQFESFKQKLMENPTIRKIAGFMSNAAQSIGNYLARIPLFAKIAKTLGVKLSTSYGAGTQGSYFEDKSGFALDAGSVTGNQSGPIGEEEYKLALEGKKYTTTTYYNGIPSTTEWDPRVQMHNNFKSRLVALNKAWREFSDTTKRMIWAQVVGKKSKEAANPPEEISEKTPLRALEIMLGFSPGGKDSEALRQLATLYGLPKANIDYWDQLFKKEMSPEKLEELTGVSLGEGVDIPEVPDIPKPDVEGDIENPESTSSSEDTGTATVVDDRSNLETSQEDFNKRLEDGSLLDEDEEPSKPSTSVVNLNVNDGEQSLPENPLVNGDLS